MTKILCQMVLGNIQTMSMSWHVLKKIVRPIVMEMYLDLEYDILTEHLRTLSPNIHFEVVEEV